MTKRRFLALFLAFCLVMTFPVNVNALTADMSVEDNAGDFLDAEMESGEDADSEQQVEPSP